MLPFIVYGSSALLALLLLAIFRARRWYWHVLSVLAAFGIGLTPIPPRYNTNEVTLAIGFVFTFLFLWGAAAPFFGRKRT